MCSPTHVQVTKVTCLLSPTEARVDHGTVGPTHTDAQCFGHTRSLHPLQRSRIYNVLCYVFAPVTARHNSQPSNARWTGTCARDAASDASHAKQVISVVDSGEGDSVPIASV